MMRLVKVSIELVVPLTVPPNPESISSYLNDMLWNEPDFFNDFGPENIVEVRELE